MRLRQTVIDAAVAAGVRRIVCSSFLTAAPDATFTFAPPSGQHAIQLLLPAGGLVPGYACQRCGALSSSGDGCLSRLACKAV